MVDSEWEKERVCVGGECVWGECVWGRKSVCKLERECVFVRRRERERVCMSGT